MKGRLRRVINRNKDDQNHNLHRYYGHEEQEAKEIAVDKESEEEDLRTKRCQNYSENILQLLQVTQ